MLGFGVLWKKSPPKTVNIVFGYRTNWSMKSQETWNFAHMYIAKIWRYTGVPLASLPIMLLVTSNNYNKDILDNIMTITMIVQLVCFILAIVPTEIALRKRFDEKGNRNC
jgi:uncharacterized membrane protein